MAWCVSREEKDCVERSGANSDAAARRGPTSKECHVEAKSSIHSVAKSAHHHHNHSEKNLEPDKHIKEFMNLVRGQLHQILQRQDQIVQRQDQQFDLLQRSQTRVSQSIDTLQQSAREQWESAREDLQSVKDLGKSLQPPGLSVKVVEQLAQPGELLRQLAPEQHPQKIDIGEGMKFNNVCTLREPEVLEDTLHDLIGLVREEYARLKEVRKINEDHHPKDEQEQTRVMATSTKQMRDSLDRTSAQVSSYASKDAVQPSKTPYPQAAHDARHASQKRGSAASEFLPSMTRHVSRVATEREVNEKLDALLGDSVDIEIGDDFFRRLVKHRLFELIFGSAILLNTALMAGEMQYVGIVAGADIGFADTDKPPGWIEDLLDVFDKAFLCIFTIELLLKILGLRKQFCFSAWNFLDFVIVSFGILEAFAPVSMGLDPMTLRLARLVKLTRFLKMFRMAGHLFVLNLIMKSVAATLSTLAWSMLLLTMVQAVFGMLVGQLVYSFLADPDGDPTRQQAVYRYYGTFTRTMFTMFEVTHVNYSRAARILTENVGESWAWFFVLYRMFVGFAILQVVRAVFIQQTLKVADNDKELRLMTHDKERKKLVNKLSDVFDLFDIDGMDAVGMHEFVSLLQIPRVQVWFSTLDIDCKDPEMLFHLLDLNADGELTRDEFVHGAAHLRGTARSLDLFHVFDLAMRLDKKVDFLVPEQFHVPTRTQSVLMAHNSSQTSLRDSGCWDDPVAISAAV